MPSKYLLEGNREARMKERKKTAGRQLPFPSLFPSLLPSLLLFLHKESSQGQGNLVKILPALGYNRIVFGEHEECPTPFSERLTWCYQL